MAEIKRKRAPIKAVVPKSKRVRLAAAYHSSSEEENEEHAEKPPSKRQNGKWRSQPASNSRSIVSRPHPEDKPTEKQIEDELSSGSEEEDRPSESAEESLEDDEGESDSATSEVDSVATSTTSSNARAKLKRNDPAAFANSISKILDAKLTQGQRADPVLARSKDAAKASKEFNDTKLEFAARKKVAEDKKALQERGRVKDVLGLESTDVSSGAVAEEEKVLKKTAQRGVIKLFNAVRAAQVKGEEAGQEAKASGTIGIDKRQERVNEISKQNFLNMLNAN